MVGYTQIRATDSLVLALYDEGMVDGLRPDSRIHVFDWNGNPLTELCVPPITDFTVSIGEDSLYLFDFESSHVFSCALPIAR